MDNGHVKELFSILKENGRDTGVLTAILGSVSEMERQLSAATAGLASMRRELSTMRDERNHPVRTLMEKTSRSLSNKIGGLRARLKTIRDGIVGGCKRAVEAFKDKGISALNNLAEFFDVKQILLAQREGINACIEQAQASIAKIEAASEAAHAAGRAIKNVGRAMAGKEPIPDIKPNGRLARLIEAPYHSEVSRLNRALRSVNKTLASLDRLEKAAAKSAEADRPSTRETMKKLQKQIDSDRAGAPAKAKAKRKEAEL
jgi:prefoldin subunit 5